jgi:RNA polymerase sigma-70 factor (ECF subfamily)
MSVPGAADRATISERVLAFRAGEADAREWLARRACRLALRTSAAILRREEQAREVAQDVAVEVLQSLGGLRDPEAFDAWVHRITVRRALRAARSRRAREAVERELGAVGAVGAGGAAVGRLGGGASANGDRDTVIAARAALTIGLAKLPARQRLALALRYVHDLSDEEIGAALGCRTGTVHALLSRGRAALRADPGLIELSQAIAGDT